MARYGDIAPTAGPRSERRPHPGMEDKIDMAVATRPENIALLRTSGLATIVAATLFGIAIWFVNIIVLAVPLGRPWFAMGPSIPPFIYHAIFFGPPLGLYFASRLPFSARSA